MSKEVIYIFIGGGTGSALRYFIQLLMHERIVPYHFPWATFTVNLLGSFLIGLFYALSERFHLPFEVRLFLTTGLCGGFTTFSTFSSDGVGLLKGEFYGVFILYTLISIGIVCIILDGYRYFNCPFGKCLVLRESKFNITFAYPICRRNGHIRICTYSLPLLIAKDFE